VDIELLFRITFFIILFLVFSISAYYRRVARADGDVIERKDEGLLVLIARMGLGLPLLFSLLLYVFYPPWLAWSALLLPLWLRLFFLLVALVFVPLIWWVFRSIGPNISETVLIKKEHQLVMSGPYRWVRHPLYASTFLLLCCSSIIAESWFIFAYFAAAAFLFRFVVIPQEEKRLVGAFGDEYRRYQRRTGALLPRVFGVPSDSG
jgi:protein-S-isoprenylcysteine O-methyltransferase Ste14